MTAASFDYPSCGKRCFDSSAHAQSYYSASQISSGSRRKWPGMEPFPFPAKPCGAREALQSKSASHARRPC